MDFLQDPRFCGIEPFENKVWLATPTMHGDEKKWVDHAIDTNWVSTVGENINEVEKQLAAYIDVKYAVGLSAGTASLHLATRLAGERLYGQARPDHGTLEGHKVFCSDMTFDATINPVAYEDGEAVFIDTEPDTWNMSPEALEKAFELYPDVKLVVIAHLYGTPGKVDELRAICDRHGALIVEDAAESLGATYKGKETGTLGDYNCISFNGNKIITGSAGGMFLTDSLEDANKVRKLWQRIENLGIDWKTTDKTVDTWTAAHDVLRFFKQWVEYNKGWEVILDADSRNREKIVQRVMHLGALSYIKANNLDMSCEPDEGRGPLDFKVSYGGDKTLIELKLSSNDQYLHGYEVQLIEYGKAEQTNNLIYVLIDLGNPIKVKRVQELHDKMFNEGQNPPDLIVIDSKEKQSASRA